MALAPPALFSPVSRAPSQPLHSQHNVQHRTRPYQVLLPRKGHQSSSLRREAAVPAAQSPRTCLTFQGGAHSQHALRHVAAHAVSLGEASKVQTTREERGPVIVIDNYDSFTYNLCQYLGNLGCQYVVYRNDDISLEELERLQPQGLLISPGPGTPDDSGISLEVVRTLGPKIPLFGVCMGLQCIGQAFGGDIVRAPKGVMHGKTSPVYHNQADEEYGLLAGLPNPFTACRYHSLVIDKATFPDEQLDITAWTEDGLVMGVKHKQFPHLEGVQFHPESVITSNGMDIVRNFVKTVDKFWS